MRKDQIGLILLFTVFLILPGLLSAQMVTASFDPTQPVFLPAAAGWRIDSFVGFSYSEANGSRTIDDDEVYKFDSSGVKANIGGKFSNISVEAYLEQQKTDVKGEYLVNGWINLDRESGRLSVAMLGNDFVTVGLGGHTDSYRDYFDSSHDSETTTETNVLGSISVKAMDVIYIGGGFGRVKEQSTHTVDNNWNYAALGLGAIFGEPGETRFRFEYSWANSPEAESKRQGEEEEAIHFDTTTTRMAAELMISGLLFSFSGKEETRKLNETFSIGDEDYNDIKIMINEAGVLWVPQNGLTLGFYFGSKETDFYFKDKLSEFKVNIAYIFE